MKVRVFQIFGSMLGDQWVPTDKALAELAREFAATQLERPVDFPKDFKNLWVACEVDADEKPIRCLGMLGMVLRVDFNLFRFIDNVACKKLVERANDFLHDQGARGAEVLVYISSKDAPQQMCPSRDEWMEAFKLVPADRWVITVK